MNNYIRKISIGSDYKNAMHYVVDQDVMGGSWKIHAVSQDEEDIICGYRKMKK